MHTAWIEVNGVRLLTIDRQKRRGAAFERIQLAENRFARQLRGVAKQVGDLIRGMAPDGYVVDLATLEDALRRYAEVLTPWATRVATAMLTDVDRRNISAWAEHSSAMGESLRKEIERAPVGKTFNELLASQVSLIKSLPVEAAERVHVLTTEAIINSQRASEIAKMIAQSGEVTKARANVIARTEVARTASALTQARSEYIGASHYYWRTAEDKQVRPSHRRMDGRIIAWNSPPTLTDGMTGHAGQFPNCRCYPEPILDEVG